jgi:hypothetical protein
MILVLTLLGVFANPIFEFDAKKANNKRTKIGLRQEIFFIGSGLFF